MSKYLLAMSLGTALIVTGCGGSEEEVTIPVDPDDYEVTVSLENVDNGDVFDTIV
ncbi:hypothetical protein [Salicibibacter kimchii]|uniref:hypothetical protein n=1 Tax=Salicibibacter kimchii TaxID=2099786 RepID=UPI00135900B8|nr:hypothetical protein [Salicibibacter kimchii]